MCAAIYLFPSFLNISRSLVRLATILRALRISSSLSFCSCWSADKSSFPVGTGVVLSLSLSFSSSVGSGVVSSSSEVESSLPVGTGVGIVVFPKSSSSDFLSLSSSSWGNTLL